MKILKYKTSGDRQMLRKGHCLSLKRIFISIQTETSTKMYTPFFIGIN